ncbi:hypothetical protein ACS0TY_021084 [Phlomoides rotata]
MRTNGSGVWPASNCSNPCLNRNRSEIEPPPPVNDTNPYNVFRPREKAHRLHTRRMQRRENNVQSFEKLRQVTTGYV